MQIFQKGNQIHFLQSISSFHKRLLIESLDLISSYASYKLVQIPHDEVIHLVAIPSKNAKHHEKYIQANECQ